ncbi:MAG: Calx-beta domain-containing protein, partial [Candidatus Neomarinimicrobiota bacterium]
MNNRVAIIPDGRPLRPLSRLFLAWLFLTSLAWGQTIGFNSASSNADEGVGTVSVRIDLVGYTTEFPVTVELSVVGGSTTASGADYSVTEGELSYSSNGAKYISVTYTEDALDEFGEDVTLGLAFESSGSISPNSQHTLTIDDNDAEPTIQFTSSTGSGSEGAAGNMQLTLSAVSGKTVQVNYTVTGGTATGGGMDYSLASSTATISIGQTTTNITATINDDPLAELGETIEVTLTPLSSTNSTIGANTVHTYTITDNDTDPTVQFQTTTSTNDESVTAVNITVELSTVSGKNVSVNYSVGGTSTAADHDLTAGALVISAGQATDDISITVTNDVLDEDNETIILTLSSPTNASLGTNTTHTYTIQDQDATPAIDFNTATDAGLENATPVLVQIDLTAVSGRDATVDYAVTGGTATGSGTDYTLASGTATIAAGNSNTTFNLVISDDVLDEGNETVIVTITNPSNASLGVDQTHTYTITDDDAIPSIQFTNPTSSANEGAGSVNLEVLLSTISGRAATVNYAVTGGTALGGGTDYTLAAGIASVTAGQLTVDIPVTIVEESLYETDETVIVTLSIPGNASLGGNTVHTLTLTDNDSPPTVEFTLASSNGNESTAAPTYEISISAVSAVDVTVDYSASGGTATSGGIDYTLASNTATVTAGLTTTTISATIVDDILDEDDETFVITLSNAGDATILGNNTHTYTITDNDATPVIDFTAATSTGAEN